MCNHFNATVDPAYRKEKMVLVRQRQADISKAKRLLGFKPETSLDEGLKFVHDEAH